MLDDRVVEIPYCTVDGGKAPQSFYNGDAGMDLVSRIDAIIEPFHRALIPCGFSLAIPEGYCGLVIPRSGLALNHGITVLNAPGLIDSGYRGEIKVILANTDPETPFEVHAGDRIAQLSIVACTPVRLVPSEKLPESQRGERGFGSSNK